MAGTGVWQKWYNDNFVQHLSLNINIAHIHLRALSISRVARNTMHRIFNNSCPPILIFWKGQLLSWCSEINSCKLRFATIPRNSKKWKPILLILSPVPLNRRESDKVMWCWDGADWKCNESKWYWYLHFLF